MTCHFYSISSELFRIRVFRFWLPWKGSKDSAIPLPLCNYSIQLIPFTPFGQSRLQPMSSRHFRFRFPLTAYRLPPPFKALMCVLYVLSAYLCRASLYSPPPTLIFFFFLIFWVRISWWRKKLLGKQQFQLSEAKTSDEKVLAELGLLSLRHCHGTAWGFLA